MKRWLVLLLVAGCVTTPTATPPTPVPAAPPVVKPDLEGEARQAIDHFVTAAEQGEFAAVRDLLTSALRDRYTPELLGRDFGLDPLAKERVLRIKEKRGSALVVAGDTAHLEWAPGRQLRLTREGGSWKIAALE